MALEIKTGKHLKRVEVDIDGNKFIMSAPGAGDEMALQQAQRRVDLLSKKYDRGEATEEDLDRLDKLESLTVKIFERMFRDETEDNHLVKEWVSMTPASVLFDIVQEIGNQVEEQKNAANTEQAVGPEPAAQTNFTEQTAGGPESGQATTFPDQPAAS